IYLFELRHVGNIGVDYQDCMMLVTLNQGSNCPPAGDPVRSATHPVGESWLPPVFQNINPANANMVTDKEMFGLKTKITNINDPADVKVYLNGALQTGSQYNMGTKEVTGNLKLNNGSRSEERRVGKESRYRGTLQKKIEK